MLSTEEIMKYVLGTGTPSEEKSVGFTEAEQIGEALGAHSGRFRVDQSRIGLNTELEHGGRDPATEVPHNEPMVTGKIALAHLNEIDDYHTQLAVMEQEADRVKSTLQRGGL